MRPVDADILEEILELVAERGNVALARRMRGGDLVLVWDRSERWLSLVSRGLRDTGSAWDSVLGEGPVGEPWGEWRKDFWRPSLAAIVRVGGAAGPGRVVLGEEAVQFFLYGRDVFGSGIVEADRSLAQGDDAWVCSRRGDAIGLGTIVGPWGSSGPVLRPTLDLGWYLREGG